MTGNYENDTMGLARAVAAARHALIPQLLSPDGDLDTLEAMRLLNAPFPLPPRGASPLRGKIHGAMTVQKNRFFWREQKVLEHATGLLRRLVTGAAGHEKPARKSLLFVIPYDIADGTTGGASRLYGLAKCMGRHFDVRMLTLVSQHRDPDAISLFEGVTLYVVPRSEAFMRRIESLRATIGDAAALLAMHEGADDLPLLSYWIETLGADVLREPT